MPFFRQIGRSGVGAFISSALAAAVSCFGAEVNSSIWKSPADSYAYSATVTRTDYLYADGELDKDGTLQISLYKHDKPLVVVGKLTVVCSNNAIRIDEEVQNEKGEVQNYSEYENADHYLTAYDGSNEAQRSLPASGLRDKGLSKSEFLVFLPQSFNRKWGRFPWLNDAGLQEGQNYQWVEEPVKVERLGSAVRYSYYRRSAIASNNAGPIDQRITWDIQNETGLPLKITSRSASKNDEEISFEWTKIGEQFVPKSIMLDMFLARDGFIDPQLFRRFEWELDIGTAEFPTAKLAPALVVVEGKTSTGQSATPEEMAKRGRAERYLSMQADSLSKGWKTLPLVVGIIAIFATVGLVFSVKLWKRAK